MQTVPPPETALSIWRKARPHEYQQGAKAYAAMRPDERCVDAMSRLCPHRESSREWADWTAGFLDAAEDAAVRRFETDHTHVLDRIRAGMARETRVQARLSDRLDRRIPSGQELRDRLLAARVPPDHDTHFGSPISPG